MSVELAVHHIATPIPSAKGRGNLCGAPQDEVALDGLDQAYKAVVEGWNLGGRLICQACLQTAVIAMTCDAPKPPCPHPAVYDRGECCGGICA